MTASASGALFVDPGEKPAPETIPSGKEGSDVDEVMVRQAVKLLTARLPSWTVWYGRHTGRFWALLNQRPGVHIEARTPAELEAQAAEVERWLLGAVIEEHAPPAPSEARPLSPRPRPRRNPEAR